MKKKPTKRDMGALLGLLKDHPELVHALIVDHAKVQRLLKTKAARQLVSGVSARKMLMSAGAPAGGPAIVCYRTLASTAFLPWVMRESCMRGTYLACGPPTPPRG